MGGTDDVINLTNLTGREHFIVHLILVRLYPENNKLIYAAWAMVNNWRKCNRKKHKVSARVYEELKREWVIRANRSGTYHTEEAKQKMSEAAKGRIVSDDTKQKLSLIRRGEGNNFYGKTHSDESKQKMSQSAKNRNIDEQTELLRRSKIGDAHRGKNLTAKHCENISKSKQGSKNPMFGKTGKDNKRSKPVNQYSLNGEFIKCWDNAKDAAKELGLSYGGIRQCCQLGIKKSGNFVWRFAEKN
jgi:hypothetical protein